MTDGTASSGFLSDPAAEREWIARHMLQEADRAFRRARRRALARRIAAYLCRCRTGPENVAPGEREVPFSCVVGLAERHGGYRRPLLRGGLLPAWRQAYWGEEADGHAPPQVRRGPDGWCLTGGFAAWLRVEILRARGQRRLRVRVEVPEAGEAAAVEAGYRCACQAC